MSFLRNIVKRIPGTQSVYALVWRTIRRIQVTRDFINFRARSLRERPGLVPVWRDRQFFLANRTQQTAFDRHYVYHTAWAVRQLQQQKPREHVDISSSLYFVALGSAVVPMRHLDYRPPLLKLDDLVCTGGDLMALPFPDNSIESLSCMHVIEHIGLARYGDPLDPQGDVKAAMELSRVLAPGGRFLFATPVGRRRICFNGHRIYDFDSVRLLFPALHLAEWSLVPDDPLQGLLSEPPRELINSQEYACGCFVFQKPL